MFSIIYEVNTIILHFLFCILHLGNSPINDYLSFGNPLPPGCNVMKLRKYDFVWFRMISYGMR